MDDSKPRSSGVRKVVVGAEHAGRRLDNFLAGEIGKVPRSYLHRILRKGEVRVNGGRAKADLRLNAGDEVRIPPQRRSAGSAQPSSDDPRLGELAGRVLHEDDELIVLDKPQGIPSHGGTGHAGGVIELFRVLRGSQQYLELAHRLDRDTSGCLMLAKTRPMLRRLQDWLKAHELDKRYLTLVKGHWPAELAEVDMALADARDSGGRRRANPDAAGKSAKTSFRVLRHLRGASYLEVTLETGRMHQIRAHAAALGYPLAGDSRYGDPAFNARLKKIGLSRIFLHAHRLQFPDEYQSGLLVSAPLPEDLRAALDIFGE